ncbi:hypothetical protein VitviT2T_010189 [Vitis vinifera]|uniref:Reverse transcriptase Ty1/copia-type domain-containing protein n=1 Tax=Vitis vinifera TaxID=29760 RepID=A0ABY9C7M4_VITVI|nr:hypothetical protein VitviT2T_010189 [Vitis vinifera]
MLVRFVNFRNPQMDLKQSPRVWFDRFTNVVKKHRYIQGQTDHTLFNKHSLNGKITIFIVYIDDIILTRNHTNEMDKLRKLLANEFVMKTKKLL